VGTARTGSTAMPAVKRALSPSTSHGVVHTAALVVRALDFHRHRDTRTLLRPASMASVTVDARLDRPGAVVLLVAVNSFCAENRPFPPVASAACNTACESLGLCSVHDPNRRQAHFRLAWILKAHKTTSFQAIQRCSRARCRGDARPRPRGCQRPLHRRSCFHHR